MYSDLRSNAICQSHSNVSYQNIQEKYSIVTHRVYIVIGRIVTYYTFKRIFLDDNSPNHLYYYIVFYLSERVTERSFSELNTRN